MAKRRVITKGFAYTRKALDVPDSPEGFEWPPFRGDNAATSDHKRRLAGALQALMAARGLNHMQFAGQFLGEEVLPNGKLQRQGAGNVRRWLVGEAWPSPMMARKIGSFFKVPMARLLQYDGPPPEQIYLRVPKGLKRRANGHGGNGLAKGHATAAARGGLSPAPDTPELPPPRVIPKGAKPVIVKIETNAVDASWCEVSVAGTLPLDVGLGLLAYIERHKNSDR